MDEDEIPIARGGYNIDFDSLDLDNFDPFKTKTKVTNNFDENAPLGLSTKPNSINSNSNIPNGHSLGIHGADDSHPSSLGISGSLGKMPAQNLELNSENGNGHCNGGLAVSGSLSNSPDENKNPNAHAHAPSSAAHKRAGFKSRTALGTKPAQAATSAAGDGAQKKTQNPKERKQSLKDKIAEMRRKKEAEKKSLESNSNDLNSAASAGPTATSALSSLSLNSTSNTAIEKSNSNSLSKLHVPASNKLSSCSDGSYNSTSAPTTLASDVNLPDSAASDMESLRNGQAPTFGMAKLANAQNQNLKNLNQNQQNQNPQNQFTTASQPANLASTVTVEDIHCPAGVTNLNETDFATPQASPTRAVKTPVTNETRFQSGEAVNNSSTYSHDNSNINSLNKMPPSKNKSFQNQSAIEQESKISLFGMNDNDSTMETESFAAPESKLLLQKGPAKLTQSSNPPAKPFSSSSMASSSFPKSYSNGNSSRPSANGFTASSPARPLPAASQEMLNICKSLINSIQRDHSMYEQSLERYQENENKQIKEAADRAEIEEEYNQIKLRYDKLRDNQKKSHLPSIRNHVSEQNNRNEGKLQNCTGMNSAILQEFDEFKKKQHAKLRHICHENTVLKGNLKISEQKNAFLNRKVETQNEMANTARKQQQETIEEFELATTEITELKEMIDKQNEQIIALTSQNDALQETNRGLENLVDELMPLQ